MKKINSVLACLIFCIVCSCNNSNNSSQGESATVQDESGGQLGKEESEFMSKAAQGGMMEVELGKIAQQNCSNKRVKQFGIMMVKDHSKANEELKKIALSKNITLPNSMGEDHQKHFDKLKKKNGVEFDKEYMEMMVDDHKKDIKKFEDVAEHSKDAQLKEFATNTLPVLRMHQDSAKAIYKQAKVTLPVNAVSEGIERQSYP